MDAAGALGGLVGLEVVESVVIGRSKIWNCSPGVWQAHRKPNLAMSISGAGTAAGPHRTHLARNGLSKAPRDGPPDLFNHIIQVQTVLAILADMATLLKAINLFINPPYP